MAGSVVPFKVYLIYNDSDEAEIRRFGLPALESSFHNFSKSITELFPTAANKLFKVYWEDEDGDRVAISSDVEFMIALKSMNSGTRKFYVKIQSSVLGSPEDENSVLHTGVYCDECEQDIVGFRYKCLMCKNYDLCRICEKAGLHAEHLMLKIPFPSCLDRGSLKKLAEFVALSIPLKYTTWPQRRRHSHDTSHSDSHRKKKRSENRDAGRETGDEMDEGFHKKHLHKKCRKPSACSYSQMMDYFIPLNLGSGEASKKTQEEGGHTTYLKSIASTIQKLLDPLGVNVELEVRQNPENSEKAKEEEKKNEEKPPTPDMTPSAPPQKEVRFASPEQIANTVRQGIEEIAKTLANQKLSNGNSPDNDGWVSYEELRRDCEESQGSNRVESVQKTPEQEGSATQTDKAVPEPSSEATQAKSLYPELTPQELLTKMAISLEQMLSMGFKNDGNCLIRLLEANEGDIYKVLEALDSGKKV